MNLYGNWNNKYFHIIMYISFSSWYPCTKINIIDFDIISTTISWIWRKGIYFSLRYMKNEQNVYVIVMFNSKYICSTCFSINIICDSIEWVIHKKFPISTLFQYFYFWNDSGHQKGKYNSTYIYRNKCYLIIRPHKLTKSTRGLTFFEIKNIFEFLTIVWYWKWALISFPTAVM